MSRADDLAHVIRGHACGQVSDSNMAAAILQAIDAGIRKAMANCPFGRPMKGVNCGPGCTCWHAPVEPEAAPQPAAATYRCGNCGADVQIDRDGCCVHCGRDCTLTAAQPAATCSCAAIQAADPSRHFKGCERRVEKTSEAIHIDLGREPRSPEDVFKDPPSFGKPAAVFTVIPTDKRPEWVRGPYKTSEKDIPTSDPRGSCARREPAPLSTPAGGGSEEPAFSQPAAVGPWRVGRKVARNIYRGEQPIAMVATSQLAAEMVSLLNGSEKEKLQ